MNEPCIVVSPYLRVRPDHTALVRAVKPVYAGFMYLLWKDFIIDMANPYPVLSACGSGCFSPNPAAVRLPAYAPGCGVAP